MQEERSRRGGLRRPCLRLPPGILAHHEVTNWSEWFLLNCSLTLRVGLLGVLPDSESRATDRRVLLEETVKPLDVILHQVPFGFRPEVNFPDLPLPDRAMIPGAQDQLLALARSLTLRVGHVRTRLGESSYILHANEVPDRLAGKEVVVAHNMLDR